MNMTLKDMSSRDMVQKDSGSGSLSSTGSSGSVRSPGSCSESDFSSSAK